MEFDRIETDADNPAPIVTYDIRNRDMNNLGSAAFPALFSLRSFHA